ncbi:cytochrome P450 2G1-like isoform X2 [Hyla sarda]|uniref:cytochrome P450 2G1-like isoform X2 n=1 Tax=Hyla sarda TaxID=327740 RepID=UPI0024C465E9|nr:cytochrome P450 2G1-like isoform X2 [Hyla sarda]
MDLTWFVSLLLALIISWFIYSTWDSIYRRRNLPPGPTPLPIVGNVLQIKRGEMVKSLMELREKYGSIYTVYFGHRPIVVLCGYDNIKGTLIDRAEEFSGRGMQPAIDQYMNGHGIVFSNGSRWRDQRRFSLTALRNFGMGKKSIEERIQEEASFVIDEIKTQKEQFIDPTRFLVQAVANVICSVVFGNRFEYSNDSFQNLLTMFGAVFRDMSSVCGQEKDNPNFDRENMKMTVLNLFFAGTETVSSTLRHGLLILMRYPEIQAKLHEEIDRVIGENRFPNTDDRSNMPYMNAVLHEIQRYSDVLPLNVPHTTTKDVHFKGYTIPKGTDVYPLLCTVHQDPTKLDCPTKFDPNNFLDDKGCFKKNDCYMPFSAGKRMCVGEGLAKMELFIFLTMILQNFRLSPEKQLTDEDIQPLMAGVANMPKFYRVKFIPRV